ncbi:MAG: DUF547 domain-containing protein [Sphingomonas sp.]|uniref:DUF547 domain-containing protein n=1 Tax=Sphingomonas sp. TaxID=28214 RepID=UPI0026014BF4|nr:DUF547 domain-containing protein [Sphingomonas sp.]MBY0285324.1 DUF547 domain-containing protein [Sphingomonas sp.]
MTTLLALGALATTSFAEVVADQARLARFETSNPQSNQTIEYKVIDSALDSLVISSGSTTEVRYDAIKGDGERILTQLVSGFATVDPTTLNADEQLAYWLNLRALLVLRSAAQAFPAAKPDTLLAPGSTFFTTKGVRVAGVDLSIADIDAIVLKRAAANPNVVYGLVLPVRESPAFPRKAYRGATVNASLDAAARAFINRSGAVKADADTAKVPQFLISHRDRLGGDDTALLAHIRGLAAPKLGERLIIAKRLSADPRLNLNVFADRSFADRVPNGGFSGGGGGGSAAGS